MAWIIILLDFFSYLYCIISYYTILLIIWAKGNELLHVMAEGMDNEWLGCMSLNLIFVERVQTVITQVK